MQLIVLETTNSPNQQKIGWQFKEFQATGIKYMLQIDHGFDASCLEICYFLIKFVLKFGSTRCNALSLFWCQFNGNLLCFNKMCIEIKRIPSNWHQIQAPNRSLFCCKLLGNLLFRNSNCVEILRIRSNWHQIQVPFDAILAHCFDANC